MSSTLGARLHCLIFDHAWRAVNGPEVVKRNFELDLRVACPRCGVESRFLVGSTAFQEWAGRITGEDPI